MRILKPKALCCSYSAILRIALLFNFIITAYSSCGDPPRLLYAEPKPEFLSQQNFPKDSVVQYNCRPGYMRVPGAKNSITCLDDTWSDPPKAFCSRRPCPTPPDVDNGYFEAEDFLFGSTIYYFCNAGYIMLAKKHYRECKADGTWSNAIPECEAVLCMPPYFISNGIYEPQKDEYTYLDAVRYTCNGYLALKGESSIFCTENGTWSSEAPTCTAVDCPDPKVPNAIRLSGFVGPYTLDSAVTFKCKRGFKIYGATSSICKINSQWEPPLPECEEISCGNPGQTENGHFNAVNFKVDSIAWYSCNQGYIMTTTPHFRVCRENGTWSDNVPQCKVKCPEPRIRNMMILGGKHPYVFDSLVTFQCNSGYTINGPYFSICSRNGQWKPTLPECLRDKCPTPEIRNGHIKDKNKIEPAFHPGDTVTAECDMGYVLNGIHTITCLSNREWSPLVPTCVPRVSCPEPVVVNGRIKEGTPKTFQRGIELGYEVNTSVKVKCSFWYSMEGEDTIFCRHDLKWYPKVPTCMSSSDCSYPDIKNGKVILLDGKKYTPQLVGYSFSKGVTIHTQCDPGFTMRGCDSSTCTSSWTSNWSPNLPVCVSGKQCPKPEIRNGYIKSQCKTDTDILTEFGYYPGDTMDIECDIGYVLNGSNTVTCLSNSEWSSSLPTCVPRVSCTEPVVFNGEIEEGTPRTFQGGIENGYKVLDIVKVKCDFFYKMKGQEIIVCAPNLTWHPKVPICEALKDCSYPDIKNGKIILLNGKDYNPQLIGYRFRKETVIHVQCDPGFIMSGSSNSTCTSGWVENYWSPELPVCASE